MPRDGSGTYIRDNGVSTGTQLWRQQRDTTATVDAPTHDAEANDIAGALTDSLAKDGQTVAAANLPMGGFRHTSVSDGATRNQYASVAQIQDGKELYAIATGTGDAMVTSFTPVITAVVDGQQFRVRAVAANTITTPTFQVGATTARTIVKSGGAALAVGDYVAGMEIILRYKNLATPVYELLTPVQVDTSGSVPSSRQVLAGGLLTGGGPLSSDVTITGEGADQAEAETGTDNTKLMTPLRTTENVEAKIADQAAMEAGTAVDQLVPPGRQQHHPGHPKAWVYFNGTGTVTILASYNVSSVTDLGTGQYRVNFTTAFSSANYCGVVQGTDNATLNTMAKQDPAGQTASSFDIAAWQPGSSTRADIEFVHAAFFGDQ